MGCEENRGRFRRPIFRVTLMKLLVVACGVAYERFKQETYSISLGE